MLYGAMNFPVRPLLDELESIAGMGFDYLELAMDSPRAHHSVVSRQKNRLLESLRRHNMKIVCHLPSFLWTADLTESLRTASQNELIQSLEVAADLEPIKVVLHPSYVTGLGLFVIDQARQYAMESLEAVVSKAEELGVILCLENMFPQANGLSEPDEFAEVLGEFPSLRLTLDTGHARIGGKGDRKTLDFIERFADRLAHVHTGDNFGKQDNHLPVGAGTTDFRKIVKALKKIGYDDTVTFEVFSPDRDFLRISRDKFANMMANVEE